MVSSLWVPTVKLKSSRHTSNNEILSCIMQTCLFINVHPLIGRFQAIKTDVLLIFSFITGDKTEFLSPMMFSNEYITGI